MRQKLGINRKKTWYSSQATTERVQKLREEYWEKIKDIEPENLVFLDETGLILGLNIALLALHVNTHLVKYKRHN
jgi:hypothetical protein